MRWRLLKILRIPEILPDLSGRSKEREGQNQRGIRYLFEVEIFTTISKSRFRRSKKKIPLIRIQVCRKFHNGNKDGRNQREDFKISNFSRNAFAFFFISSRQPRRRSEYERHVLAIFKSAKRQLESVRFACLVQIHSGDRLSGQQRLLKRCGDLMRFACSWRGQGTGRSSDL